MNRSGVPGLGCNRAAAENASSAGAWPAESAAGCICAANPVNRRPQSWASASSIQRAMRVAIGLSAGVSDATDDRTSRATSSGCSTANHSEMRPPPDSASTATGPSGGPRLRAPTARATPSAITRGCRSKPASSGSSGSGRPRIVTGRLSLRPAHRRCRTDSMPANGRNPSSTPPSTRSGTPRPPASWNASIRPPSIGIEMTPLISACSTMLRPDSFTAARAAVPASIGP